MSNEFDPVVNQWYSHLDKGQRFFIVAVDDETVEVQYFDGNLDEIDIDEWSALDIELSETPENWSGPMDIADTDDLGTDITDTQPEDWNEPGAEFRPGGQEKLIQDETPDENHGEDSIDEDMPRGANAAPFKRADGKFEERFSDIWVAEYSEDPATGLWHVEIFKHDVHEWSDSGFTTLQEALQCANEYYNQL